ncbi:IS256 family transposase [Wolbachia endosymbiont of Armadillidium vulgare str. wVulC]|nr:IS256 family transposase [Wolbachia endosymbiont of Armadillidium vulgare str. wVulC]
MHFSDSLFLKIHPNIYHNYQSLQIFCQILTSLSLTLMAWSLTRPWTRKNNTYSKGKENRIIEEMGKTLRTSAGSFELLTPRDREGSFEPQVVRKRQTSLHPELEAKVLSTFASGMEI